MQSTLAELALKVTPSGLSFSNLPSNLLGCPMKRSFHFGGTEGLLAEIDAMKSRELPIALLAVVLVIAANGCQLAVPQRKIQPGLTTFMAVVGLCAGAGTITAALRAVQEEAQSKLPALGYTVPYAIGNILLTAWGPVIVAMMA